jgi:hypothetical protein
MSMKKLLERIDSIEQTQKTTLTESVEQGMAEAKKPRKSYPTPSYLKPMVNAFDEMMEGGADYVTAVLSLSDEFRMSPDTVDSLLRSYTPDGWALPKLSKKELLSLKNQDIAEDAGTGFGRGKIETSNDGGKIWTLRRPPISGTNTIDFNRYGRNPDERQMWNSFAQNISFK